MKTKLATTCFIISTLLVPVAAYAEDKDADRMHPMTYVKDSAITAKIKAKLAGEKMRSLAHVSVDTDSNGQVYLSGNVRTQADADKAVVIAHNTEGVNTVTSKLKIKKDD
ncbi:MAG: BON domain-containing protein [Sulfuricaulis sp.]|uniref:BON domain-containing protein n=1 Tax=Sulfuricaulis sp. TaxID=2003553 RepID=UPI0025FFBEAE|nr:BON domain-containing protein [Sulfuricaulis sp.]MCR4346420.1 BON domain-containing protein [Sulfuricaulis sp.]